MDDERTVDGLEELLAWEDGGDLTDMTRIRQRHRDKMRKRSGLPPCGRMSDADISRKPTVIGG